MTDDAQTAPLFGATPPKPVLTLRVGIAGHRPKPDVFPAENFGFVQKHLREVFVAIDGDLAKIAKAQSALYAEAAPKVRLVSGLAEGADQMAVAATPDGWTLDAVLPLPAKIYEEDFQKSAIDGKTDVTADFRKCLDTARTKLALPDDLAPQSRDEAYARLGGFLLRQIDLLVAVWDGKPEQGRGGTAEVVRAALAADLPVVWISAFEDRAARIIESVERGGRVVAPQADCLQGPLAEAIASIVLLPELDEDEDCAQEEGPDAATRLRDFLRAKWPKPFRIWLAYDLFKRLMEGKSPRWRIEPERPEDYVARWARFAEDGPEIGGLKTRLTDILCERFAWADALAVEYSHRYRSAYITTYLLAAGAVLIALLGVFSHGEVHDVEEILAHKAHLVLFEALILFVILYLVWRGRSARWKEKWMEFRALAELLVNARFLSYLGEHGRAHRLGNLEAAPSAWFLWYLRATIREIGLPSAELDGAYQRAVLSVVDKHVVVEQKGWHINNSKALNAMNRFLHGSGKFCFDATFFFLWAFLVGWFAYEAHDWIPAALPSREDLGAFLTENRAWVTFVAAFLPALGAALAGIRETGDFGKVADHSTKTAAALNELHREIWRAKRDLALEETGDALLSTAQVLTADLAAWQAVYGHKRLELPA